MVIPACGRSEGIGEVGVEHADVRLALVRETDGWRVWHGEVTLGAAGPPVGRAWRYGKEIFLERRWPGTIVAGLLRQEPQEVEGLRISAPPSADKGSFRRMTGQAEYLYVITPWPRTEWTVSPAETMPAPPDRVLVGEGPAFLNFEAAFSSFFYGKPPGNFAGQGNVWRISRLDRRGWLHRVTIGPDALVISVRGRQLSGAVVELSSPTGAMTRRVGRTGKVRLRLPAGLADGSLLLLRSDDDWLDYRYFRAPVPGRQQDPSVVWDQPGAEMSILLAGGEGPHVEFKREIPANPESRKKMLKTVAAFASGEGGTVVFGVSDDAQPVGIGSGTMDQHMLAVASMIRDSITPEPPYRLRAAEMDGRLLLAEISAGGQWYALNPAKPEFYVRRGASTVPARMDEITAGFSRKPPDGSIWF
jgi:Putative DNA-binding domain